MRDERPRAGSHDLSRPETRCRASRQFGPLRGLFPAPPAARRLLYHQRMLHRAFVTIAAVVTATLATAADYPTRPIRIVVPFTPGGQPDIFMRLVIPGLTEAFRQQVIADNRPGAGGSIGSRIVAESAPD